MTGTRLLNYNTTSSHGRHSSIPNAIESDLRLFVEPSFSKILVIILKGQPSAGRETYKLFSYFTTLNASDGKAIARQEASFKLV